MFINEKVKITETSRESNELIADFHMSERTLALGVKKAM